MRQTSIFQKCRPIGLAIIAIGCITAHFPQADAEERQFNVVFRGAKAMELFRYLESEGHRPFPTADGRGILLANGLSCDHYEQDAGPGSYFCHFRLDEDGEVAPGGLPAGIGVGN